MKKFELEFSLGIIEVIYLLNDLMTVHPSVTAHTFLCNSGARLLIQGYFFAVYNCVGNVDLSKVCWYPKRKLGLATHFAEIIEVQFEKTK